MQNLVQDLLSYSRISTRRETFAEIELQDVIKDVLSDLETSIQESNATVEIDPLPFIDADPLQMHQLFLNLIGNGIKYRRDGVAPLIKINAEVMDNGRPGANDSSSKVCRIQISDNGIGFEQKYAEQIFIIFQRLHGRDKYTGTGVGLAICQKIILRHGGLIEAKSNPGEGAAFTISLPVHHVPF